jgi:hypothetical protein
MPYVQFKRGRRGYVIPIAAIVLAIGLGLVVIFAM